MRINLKKEEFEKIENAFSVLQETPNNLTAQKQIEDSLNVCFPDYKFMITVTNIPVTDDSALFCMGILPELSVSEKIVSAVLENNEVSAIKKLWQSSKYWTIEIDSRVLGDHHFTAKELTATLLHEVGHVAYSDNIPEKLGTILKYEYAKAPMNVKALRKLGVFRKILSLPVLDACIMDGNKSSSSIKEEVKADKFAKKLGYGKDLESMLGKLANLYGMQSNSSIDDSLRLSARFSLQNVEDFRRRETKLARKHLFELKEACASEYISNVIDECIQTLYEGTGTSKSLHGEFMTEAMQGLADQAEGEYVTEFFIFGTKRLKRIDPADIDYIQVKINDIRTENDKMMLITYIYGKLDIIDYYLQILDDPKASAKYSVPHSKQELLAMKSRLLDLRDSILKYRIPLRNKNLMIAWPTDYEG